jgi:hypothetical protein
VNESRHAELMANPPEVTYPRTDGVYVEWSAACKSGGKAGSDFAAHSGPLTEMVLLGNLAVRSAKTLEIDPHTGMVTNTDIPEEFLKPTYRAGWGW